MVGKNNQQIASANFDLQLETLDHIKTLFGNEDAVQVCDGNVELKLVSTNNKLAFDGGFTAQLIVTFSTGIASGVIANAIYAAIRTGIKKLEINRRRVSATEEGIAKALEEAQKTGSSAKDEKKTNDKEPEEK